MANVLILSASTGHGHNQAAQSLKLELETSGYCVQIAEPLREEGRIIETLVEDGYHLLATRLPKMYGTLYKITYSKYLNKGIVTLFNKALGHTVQQLIAEYKPDLVISTHPLLVNVVSSLKASGHIHIPFIALVTDYMAHPFYVNQYVDAYIVGSSFTKDTLTEKGVADDKIYTYGIPVRAEFRQPRTLAKASPFTILIMGGSMGVPGIKSCMRRLVENPRLFNIQVVCGSNTKLQKELERKYAGTINGKQITIHGFARNIPELMDQSDVIVTKPGGLTVSEALNKNIPMIIPFFIPGQEEENAEILVKAGVALKVNNSSELNEVLNRLIESPALLDHMRAKQYEMSKNLSPGSIVSLADRLIYTYRFMADDTRHGIHA